MALLDQSRKNLIKVNLSTAGIRVFPILPIDDQDVHI
jgi:hypothetical protein